MKKLELLAPAGSLEICKAVIDTGADAVYLGGNMFGARAYAKNFDQEQLFEALDYAHLFDKKIFLTVNTLLKNHELEKYLYDYIEPFYKRGLDAAIVQDFGVLTFLHKHFPDLPLHASTQMSITNKYGAQWLKSQGVSRIVTAREISLKEISDIYNNTYMEIESFVHGALCYCYSGQCLLSSLLGGRSGNRGRCAQPCRLAYDVVDDRNKCYNKGQQYPLSPKDLCTIDLLPQMAKAGVFSYKIEGRMKQMEYAVGVTSIYKKYMDMYLSDAKGYKVDKKDVEALLNLGNRNGFTQGYYYNHNDKSLLSLSTSAHKSGDNKPIFSDVKSQIPISMSAKLITGEPSQLKVEDVAYSVVATGETVMEAMKQPLNAEDVKARLSKTGDTVFTVEQVDVEVSHDAFMPVKFINELRRTALEELEKKHLERYCRTLPIEDTPSFVGNLVKTVDTNDTQTSKISCDNTLNAKNTISVLVRNESQLQAVLKADFLDKIYLDSNFYHTIDCLKDLVENIKTSEKKVCLSLPYVFRNNSAQFLLDKKHVLDECNFEQLLIRTHDGLGFAKEHFSDKTFVADHGLYTYSDTASQGFLQSGIAQTTVPFELNEKELRYRDNSKSEMIVYGWIPVMYTAQCIYKNFESCHKNKECKNTLFLKDRYAKEFPVLCDCVNCYNTIYNSQPLYLFGQKSKLDTLGIAGYRLEFLMENEKETTAILKEFKEVFLEGKKADMTKWENRFTNGHFKRGIE